MKTSPLLLTPEQALALADRYFDALTTPAEEQALRRFLATPAANDTRFDAVKAVMGYLVVARRTAHPASRRQPPVRTTSLRRVVAAAACVVLVGTIGMSLFQRRNNVCVAYVYGEKCTDETVVMQEMRGTLAEVLYAQEQPDVEEQLTAIFNPQP